MYPYMHNSLVESSRTHLADDLRTTDLASLPEEETPATRVCPFPACKGAWPINGFIGNMLVQPTAVATVRVRALEMDDLPSRI